MIRDIVIRYKKIIFILGGFLIFLFLLNKISEKPIGVRISKYIENIGFRYNVDMGLYEKKLSDISLKEYFSLAASGANSNYEVLYFDINQFQLLKTKMSYFDDIYIILNSNYDYKTDKINYTYEFSYGSTSVMLEGNYIQDEDFVCEVDYQKNTNEDVEDDIGDFCDNVKLEIDDFIYESQTLITNYELLEEMKNNT